MGGEPQRARPPTAMQKLQILSQLLLQYDPSATMEVAEVGGLIMGGELGSGLESAGEAAGGSAARQSDPPVASGSFALTVCLFALAPYSSGLWGVKVHGAMSARWYSCADSVAAQAVQR